MTDFEKGWLACRAAAAKVAGRGGGITRKVIVAEIRALAPPTTTPAVTLTGDQQMGIAERVTLEAYAPSVRPGPSRHVLKTHPKPFAALRDGEKTFEWRKDDRGFEVGDMLVLLEWEPTPVRTDAGGFTGNELIRWVTYILRGPTFGVPEGYCVMSVSERAPVHTADKKGFPALLGQMPDLRSEGDLAAMRPMGTIIIRRLKTTEEIGREYEPESEPRSCPDHPNGCDASLPASEAPLHPGTVGVVCDARQYEAPALPIDTAAEERVERLLAEKRSEKCANPDCVDGLVRNKTVPRMDDPEWWPCPDCTGKKP